RVHLAGHDAPDPDEGDVEKRHAQNERRREQRDDRRVLGPVAHHRQPGEGEADERGAAVAEEDHGAARPEVGRQKAQTPADERGRGGSGGMVKRMPAMTRRPRASPSTPSRNWTALVTVTNQRIVSATFSHAKPGAQ